MELAVRRVVLHGGVDGLNTCLDVLGDVAHFPISRIPWIQVETLVQDCLLASFEALLSVTLDRIMLTRRLKVVVD